MRTVTRSQPFGGRAVLAAVVVTLLAASASACTASTRGHGRTGAPASVVPTSPRTLTVAPRTVTATVTATPRTGTVTVTVRPVTSAGAPAAGWTVDTQYDSPGAPIQCANNGTAGTASPSAVSPDIYYCTPDAASADTCWISQSPGKMLCLIDPFGTTLEQQTPDVMPPPVQPSAHPVPLGLALADGEHCRLRVGGAWDTPTQHPSWVGYYSCDGTNAVWAPGTTGSTGIDQSAATWTVQVGPSNGTIKPVAVRTAYFAGTQS